MAHSKSVVMVFETVQLAECELGGQGIRNGIVEFDNLGRGSGNSPTSGVWACHSKCPKWSKWSKRSL